jgi:hypothetical protein
MTGKKRYKNISLSIMSGSSNVGPGPDFLPEDLMIYLHILLQWSRWRIYRNNDLCDYPPGALSFCPVPVILVGTDSRPQALCSDIRAVRAAETPLKKTA